jgi:hypothetical protein
MALKWSSMSHGLILTTALRTELCHKYSGIISYLIIIIYFTNKQDDFLTIFKPIFNNK